MPGSRLLRVGDVRDAPAMADLQVRAALVAEEDGDVVGIVLAGPAPDQAQVGHLAKLYVAPARWGRGIGTELRRAAMCHLRGQGFREASLWVLEGNHRARSWYERLGWIERGGFRDVHHSVREVRYALSLPSAPLHS
jgi:GNAT superfamily N-acetyltransferase